LSRSLPVQSDKEMKHASTKSGGGGGQPPIASAHTTNSQGAKKILNKKGEVIGYFDPESDERELKAALKDDDVPLVPGAPDIAHPSDEEKYERQLCFVYAWFFEMLEMIESDDLEAAREARAELQTLLLNTLPQLRRLALKKKDEETKRWAGMILGNIYASIGKYDPKFCKTNAGYRDAKAMVGKLRRDVLDPRSRISRIVQRELKKAETHHKLLYTFREAYDEEWEAAVRRHNRKSKQKIPKAYWPLALWPKFSMESEPQWWEVLRPLIQEKINALKWPPLKMRQYDALKVSMRNGKCEIRESEKKDRKRYATDLARDVLKTFARQSYSVI
jgi:hypothetical protein